MAHAIRKRTTRQLTAVYEALQGDHSHPSAEEIHRRVQKTSPRVSLGTIYRNLQRLTEEGKIRTVRLGECSARYDPTLEDTITLFASDADGWTISGSNETGG